MNGNRVFKKIRSLLLGIIVIFISYEAYMHQVKGGASNGSPSIHALCPYGALESLYALLKSGEFIKKIFSGTFVLIFITIVLALLFRRAFCGLICPFGAIQEGFGFIGRKVFKKRFKISNKIHTPLTYLKYVVLIYTAYMAWISASLWMSPYDPWAAYGHMFGGFEEVITELLVGFILLVITIVGSFFYDRFFCKYLCPMGAFLGIVSKASPSKIKRNKKVCIDCNICSNQCPMNIDVAKMDEVNSLECINCQTCIVSCPKKGSLELKLWKRSLSPMILIVLVFSIYFGIVAMAKGADLYEFLPKKIEAGNLIEIHDLKGYMTLEEVAEYRNISVEELYIKLDLSNDIPKETRLKEVKNFFPELDVEKIKEKL